MSFLLGNCFVSAVGTALSGCLSPGHLEALGCSWRTDEELKAFKSSLLLPKVADTAGNMHRTVGESWAREKAIGILSDLEFHPVLLLIWFLKLITIGSCRAIV